MAGNVDSTTAKPDTAAFIEEHDFAWIVGGRNRRDSKTYVVGEEASHRVEIGAYQHGFNRRGIRGGRHIARYIRTGPARRNRPPLSTIIR